MQTALRLARRGLGRVWPNPAVGCVLAREGRIVGRGWTQPGGRPHAETEALTRAGGAARGATAYVSLEPCNHRGETGPCTEALIEAGVARVIAATVDPDPRVAGGGLEALRNAGLDVVNGVCEADAQHLNQGFFLRIRESRPFFTLKLATSLDGKIATHARESRWITGEEARAHGHRLRAEHDGVLIGSETAVADDPALTCRLPGLEDRSPVRIVLDSRLRIGPDCNLVKTARDVPTWIVTTTRQDPAARGMLEDVGIEIIELEPGEDGRPDVPDVAHALAARGLTRVLIEGGGGVAGAFVGADLVDELVWFRAPKAIGADGIPALAALGADGLANAPAFARTHVFRAGDDLVETYNRDSAC